jgi:Leucine-rich repeat (LRR) protein
MKIIFGSKRHHYIARVSILLIMVALIAGMVGCGGVGTVVGSAGGEVIGSGGAMVTIPPGALEEDQLIIISTLTTDDLPLPIPDNTFLLGGVRVEPSLVFDIPVTITVPLSTSFAVGTPFPVLVFDSVTNEYKLETEALVTTSGSSVTFNVSHFSYYVIPGAAVAPTDQMILKNQIIAQISEFFEQYEGRYFYDEGFLSLGDIDKVRDRLYDDDIQVRIFPEYLEDRGAIASYVDYDLWVRQWGVTLFFNDIVLAAAPSEVDGVTLYHEVMHAIDDEHDGELKAKGVPDDEALTWYMELASDYIGSLLVPADDEFAKFRQGLPCDFNHAQLCLSLFVTSLEEYKQDPGVIAGAGSGKLPAITAEALQLLEQLTGLDVDPAGIKARYESLIPEAVYFPDPNLEAAIREAIGKPTGPIYRSDLAGLTFLHAFQRNIAALTGLEHCTNLVYLCLEDSQISDISPLSNLTNLTSLYLGSNQISNISPLSNLTNLACLGLWNNQISDISPLSNLTNLTDLWLDNNQISDISPLSNLTNLTVLWVPWNQIADLSPLASLTNLASLYLHHNQISNVSALSNLTNLAWLGLWNNQIGDISPLSNLTNLTYLHLDSNQIGDISPLSNLTNLTLLFLDDNQISDISHLVQNQGLGAGDEIGLRYNPLSSNSINIYIPQLEARGVNVNY